MCFCLELAVFCAQLASVGPFSFCSYCFSLDFPGRFNVLCFSLSVVMSLFSMNSLCAVGYVCVCLSEPVANLANLLRPRLSIAL
jgi:hypothetical protein